MADSAGGTGRLGVREAFEGATVVITGCTGYIGGLVLRYLLATCSPSLILCLARHKRALSAEARIQAVLQRPGFEGIAQERKRVVRTVEACLEATSKAVLSKELHAAGMAHHGGAAPAGGWGRVMAIHAAADLDLSSTVRKALDCNLWVPLRMVHAMRSAFGHLDQFTQVSTAYVSNHFGFPPGSAVGEGLHPFKLPADWEARLDAMGAAGQLAPAASASGTDARCGGGDAGGAGTRVGTSHHKGWGPRELALAEALWAMPTDEAEAEAKRICETAGFLGNYFLVKNLTEKILCGMAGTEALPRLAIVRPTMVGSTSERDPTPGYIGNATGVTGAIICYACGMLRATPWRADDTWDLVPGETVATGVLLCAAAAAAGPAAAPGSAAPIHHLSTSASNRVELGTMFDVACKYWQEHQLQGVFRLSRLPYQPAARTCGWGQGVWAHAYELFRLYNVVTLLLLGVMLRLTGQARLANRIQTGYKYMQDCIRPRISCNLVFDNASVQRFQQRLSSEEQALFPAVWDKGQDWGQYFKLYCAGVHRTFLKPVSMVPGASKAGPKPGSAWDGHPKAT